MKKLYLILLLSIGLPSFSCSANLIAGALRSTEVYSEQQPKGYWYEIKALEGEIEKLHALRQQISSSITEEDIEYIAESEPNAQQILEFLFIRQYRNLSKIDSQMAKIALKIKDIISRNQNDPDFEPIVFEQGIAKYTEMAEFCQEYASKEQKDFQKGWREYVELYGDEDKEIFKEDDKELAEYGVESSERPSAQPSIAQTATSYLSYDWSFFELKGRVKSVVIIYNNDRTEEHTFSRDGILLDEEAEGLGAWEVNPFGYTRDEQGRISGSGNGHVAWTWVGNRVASEEYALQGYEYTSTYVYDESGKLTGYKTDKGKFVKYTYTDYDAKGNWICRSYNDEGYHYEKRKIVYY